MDKARLFKNGVNTVVYAQEVKDGIYSRYENFVDIEYEFRATYVKAAKNNGRPYFKIYVSKEDYRRLSPEQKSKYDILCELRHFQNGPWHVEWQDKFKSFCAIEKYIKNPTTGKWKYADAFYEDKKICVEFQHSYIDFYFEERNDFYNSLGIKTIWLYDLTKLEVKKIDDKTYEILEDNANGFFRISEKEENLKDNIVLIQAKDRKIYRINELKRKEIDDKLKSTIRIFNPISIYTEEEFLNAVKEVDNTLLTIKFDDEIDTLYKLWKKYKPEVARFLNTQTGWFVHINMDPSVQYNNYGKVSGVMSQDQYFNIPGKFTEVYGANKKIWKLVWKNEDK